MNDKRNINGLTKFADDDRDNNLLTYSDVTQVQKMAQETQAPAFSFVRTAMQLR